jgi:hypothetical protein
MNGISEYLELSALNSEMASAYLKDAEDECSTAVENLEDSLRLIIKLRHYSTTAEYNSHESLNFPDLA